MQRDGDMIDDKRLRLVLQEKIAQLNELSKTAIYDVRDLLANKYNVDYGTSTDIFNNRIPVDTLSYDMLYKLTTCIKEVALKRWQEINANDLLIDKYFTKQDSIEYDRPMINKNLSKDLVFKNWLQVNPDQYVCVVTIEDLIEWRNINRIRYNPRTQRRLSEKTVNGMVYKVVTLYEESLNEISELMKNNEFISDDITFNVDPTYYESPRIFKGNLIIPKDSVPDIIDGFHRLKEMFETKDLDAAWEFNCIINVTVFDETKALKYIRQKDKKNHLTEEQINQIDMNSETNFIIKKLNDSNQFHLKHTITDERFDIIRKVMDSLFNLDSKENKKLSFQERRPNSVAIYNVIESTINSIVERYNLFDTDFTASMWLVGIYLVFVSIKHEVDANKILDDIDFLDLSEKVIFKNSPTTSNYKTLKEVFNNVV